jgi:hypothetical protein
MLGAFRLPMKNTFWILMFVAGSLSANDVDRSLSPATAGDKSQKSPWSILKHFFTGVGPMDLAEVKKVFEYHSGFLIPANATGIRGESSEIDIHGNYSVWIAFEVPTQEFEAFRKVPEKPWGKQEFTKIKSEDKLDSDLTYTPTQPYVIPAGSLVIKQGVVGVRRILGLDETHHRIIFFQATP